MKNILLIVKTLTFNNKNTSVSDDFLNIISKNKYNTHILYDYNDTEYVKNYINQINPILILMIQVNANDKLIENKYFFIYSLNIPIYIFVEDTYYIVQDELFKKINGLIIWYKNINSFNTFKLLNNNLSILHFNSRFVNTNIYKDYKLEKKYDILLYGARASCVYNHRFLKDTLHIKKYYTDNNIEYNKDIIFYPLRIKLVNILNSIKDRYNICILPETSILDSNIQKISNENLSKLINQSYLTVSCSSIADALFHKHLEIPASNSVILGTYPTDYSELFKGNVIEINEFMDDTEIINIIDNALSDKQKLLDMSNTFYKKIHEEHNLLKALDNFNELLDKIIL